MDSEWPNDLLPDVLLVFLARRVTFDRIAIRDVFDDVGSKYVPPHVNISIGFGTFTSPTCVWPSLGWYTEWPDHGLTVSWP